MPVNLIDPTTLLELQKTSALGSYTVIDARPIEKYKTGHIPNAISIEWQNWVKQAPSYAPLTMNKSGWWGELLEPDSFDFEKALSSSGIDSNSSIIVYADGASSKGLDGRIAWMLLYLGARAVSLLNGGFQAWLNIQGEVERHDKIQKPACFTIATNKDRVISTEELEGLLQNKQPCTIWDCRSSSEFRGIEPEYLLRKGHIPEASLFEFNSIYKPDNIEFIEKEKYLTHIKMRNLDSGSPIAYCELGLRASSIALLHEAYTKNIVRVLDGGFFKWSSLPENIVVQDS